MARNDEQVKELRRRTNELLEALATKKKDVDLKTLFVGVPDIDDPCAGRRIGKQAMQLMTTWEPVRTWKLKTVEPLFFTTDGNQSAGEYSVRLEKGGKEIILPVVVVAEWAQGMTFRFVRLYYRRAWLDDTQHIRPRVMDARAISLLPIIDRYEEFLRTGNMDGIMSVFGKDPYLDGHGQSTDLSKGLGMGLFRGREGIRDVFTQMFNIEGHNDVKEYEDGPSKDEYLEHCNAFTDGRTTVFEFNIIRPNDIEAAVQAGVSCYELDDEGLLRAARIYDEGW